MHPEWVRERCLALPHATEHVIWGTDLTFKVAGKIFAHLAIEPAKVWLAFKVTPENFYELTERPDIIPAPYMARASYIALQTRDALRADELAALLRESYALVVAKMPRKTQEALGSGSAVKVGAAKTKPAPKNTKKKSATKKSPTQPAPKTKTTARTKRRSPAPHRKVTRKS
jgi:predicted DNA-binding protein (MmcQ/YjbR family)